MSPKRIIQIVAACLAVILVISYIGMKFSYQNKEIELRNQAKAQQESNKVIYDKVWKTIAQIAQVADKYENAFKEIYVKVMDARYGKEGDQLLFKFVQEQNPNFSTELYSQITDAIRANRAEFANVQKRLIDIKREHDNIRMTFPGSWWNGDKPEIVLQIVTSTKTEKAFSTGKEDDINVFSK